MLLWSGIDVVETIKSFYHKPRMKGCVLFSIKSVDNVLCKLEV